MADRTTRHRSNNEKEQGNKTIESQRRHWTTLTIPSTPLQIKELPVWCVLGRRLRLDCSGERIGIQLWATSSRESKRKKQSTQKEEVEAREWQCESKSWTKNHADLWVVLVVDDLARRIFRDNNDARLSRWDHVDIGYLRSCRWSCLTWAEVERTESEESLEPVQRNPKNAPPTLLLIPALERSFATRKRRIWTLTQEKHKNDWGWCLCPLSCLRIVCDSAEEAQPSQQPK